MNLKQILKINRVKMEIVSIEDITNKRVRILLDTGETFALYKGEVRLLHIKEGQDMLKETYDEIMKGILPKRAKNRALNLLKERNYTVYQLTRKLLDGGYPKNIARDAVCIMVEEGLVNDFNYAKSYIESKENSHSRNEIVLKLSSKGIEKEIIEEAFEALNLERDEFDEESSVEIEEKLIKKTLEKRKFSIDSTYEEKQKLLAYFYRRGFDIEKVRKIMDNY